MSDNSDRKGLTARALASHKWTGLQRGGPTGDAGSVEYVRYCEICGMEDTCEDPLPLCPGATSAEVKLLIAEAVAAEREACAQEAESGLCLSETHLACAKARRIAAAIRARGSR